MSLRFVSVAFILCTAVAPAFAPRAVAETVASSLRVDASQALLPACVNSESEIAEVKRLIAANSTNAKKYDGYRKLLHTDTDLVLAARLAYAETRAANCTDKNDEVLDLVAAVIGNRVRIRYGDVRSVVFQRNQFASSLHIYSESRYRDFLCPSDAMLWQKSLAKMQANLQGDAPSAPIQKDAVNYYLYQHSDRFTAPDWHLQEAKFASDETRKCIRVFRNPAWK